jgi:hypothetical protein
MALGGIGVLFLRGISELRYSGSLKSGDYVLALAEGQYYYGEWSRDVSSSNWITMTSGKSKKFNSSAQFEIIAVAQPVSSFQLYEVCVN